jgi:hypothetical protein
MLHVVKAKYGEDMRDYGCGMLLLRVRLAARAGASSWLSIGGGCCTL